NPHPMKKSLLQLFHRAVIAVAGTFLVLPLAAQGDKPSSGKVTWASASSRELDSLRQRYENAVARNGRDSDDARDLKRAIDVTESLLPWVLSFDFPGGPLSKFLGLLSKADVVSLNIISAGEPADLETVLPPFSLHNASLPTVVDVLHNLLFARGFVLAATG